MVGGANGFNGGGSGYNEGDGGGALDVREHGDQLKHGILVAGGGYYGGGGGGSSYVASGARHIQNVQGGAPPGDGQITIS